MTQKRKHHIFRKQLKSYIQMFLLSLLILIIVYGCLIILNQLIYGKLSYQKHLIDMYLEPEASFEPIIKDGGGIVILNDQLEVINKEGQDFMKEDSWTKSSWANYIQETQKINSRYSYQFGYSETGNYWLVMAFPTSVRMMFSVYYNKDMSIQDRGVILPILLTTLVFFIGLLLLVTWLFTKIISKAYIEPIEELEEKIAAFSQGRYAERIDLSKGNILKGLAQTYNNMADKIQSQLHHRRLLIQEISHDIKNPLMSTTGYCEYLLNNLDLPMDKKKEFYQIIHNDSMRAVQLADDLLQLAKLEDDQLCLDLQTKDICEWLREVIAEIIPRLDNKQFEYSFSIPQTPLYTRFDANYLRRAVDNLLGNAIKYNPPKTNLWISLDTSEDKVVLIFEDNGVGIPKDLYQNITRPYVRYERSEEYKGSGLGLSIVEKVAVRHGGRLLLDQNRYIGSKFTIELPIIR